MKTVGIDSLAYYVPSLYVDIEELAIIRDISSLLHSKRYIWSSGVLDSILWDYVFCARNGWLFPRI